MMIALDIPVALPILCADVLNSETESPLVIARERACEEFGTPACRSASLPRSRGGGNLRPMESSRSTQDLDFFTRSKNNGKELADRVSFHFAGLPFGTSSGLGLFCPFGLCRQGLCRGLRRGPWRFRPLMF
jgi:hypothetical protein